MRNKKGQATILIGIIFQVVFIFFAMVINVGLLVNDKINLQNSVDIAAYYGAMKQAEVLNTMAHVNFQIRQAWKLMNWRLWALGDIGRFQGFMNGGYANASDVLLRTDEGADPGSPAVCVRNPFWLDEYKLSTDKQNFCKNPRFNIQNIKPLTLSPVQMLPIFSFMQIFQQQSNRNANIFKNDCGRGGELNHYYATTLITSYKMAVAHRRNAMRKLQNLLIGNDLTDIRGKSVRETTDSVFKKNLTLANRESIDSFEFTNSLKGNPFLVPIDVRVLMKYTDIFGNGDQCHGEIRDIQTPANKAGSDSFARTIGEIAERATQTDYGKSEVITATAFAKETNAESYGKLYSLVGFEKNPWILAYVKVRAQTKPKMLFSPIGDGRVTLTAEAYAMPFGGRIGPWYRDSWGPDQETSGGPNKIDNLLSPRIGESIEGKADKLYEPNYSRYPGDELGMKSALARSQGMNLAYNSSPSMRASYKEDDYGIILQGIADGQSRADPVVFSMEGTKQQSQNLRKAELIAVAPDLFDMSYYSIQKNFENEFMNEKSGGYLKQLCPIGCEDFGSDVAGGVPEIKGKLVSTADDIKLLQENFRNSQTLYWKAKNVNHLNTGWTQEAADKYLPEGGGVSDLLASAPDFKGNTGGRVGYSVKIVSEDYLKRSLKLGGEKAGAAQIKNPPR